jgi:hypothetical protein
MSPDLPDSLERLSHSDLIGAMRDLVGEFTRLREKHEELIGAFAKLKVEHQAVKDELARYKKLPPRPPQKPSGMDRRRIGRRSRRAGRRASVRHAGAAAILTS